MKKLFLIVLTLCLLASAGLSEARYTDHGNGTVTDTQTGLMWQQATAPNRMNWNDAIAWCNNLSLAGYSDWRLPDIDELRSLVDMSYSPTINTTYFPNTVASWYWSSSTNAYSTGYAWVVYFYSGDGHHGTNKSLSRYVRAVRGGQSGSFGSLIISIAPSEARAAGAQWRRTGTSIWRNSGATENDLPTGSHTVEFKDVSGWTKPANISVTIIQNQTASATGTYEAIPQTGSLRVTIEPSGARSDGAQWRRTGTGTWRNSGDIESNIPAGGHTVEFKAIGGWETPASQSVTISADQEAHASGTYTPLENKHTVSATAGSGGSVAPASRTVDRGAAATFTVTPDTGHLHGTVGGDCPAGAFSENNYTTGSIVADCSVGFSFTAAPPGEHTVTATAGSGGAVTPESRTVTHGAVASFTVTPHAGFVIAGVSGCGGSLSGDTYTTAPVTEACVVTAAFSAESLLITTTVGDGGRISPESRLVASGSMATFIVTPERGYRLEISGCNGYLTGNIYITGAITAPCHITAGFFQSSHEVTATGGSGGSISPSQRLVEHGESTIFIIRPEAGYSVTNVSGCDGRLDEDLYTTGRITAPCSVLADFRLSQQVGALQVTIRPEEANRAGAQWRRVHTSAWLDSGVTESGIAIGDHQVEFQEIDGWTAPQPQTVTLSSAATAAVTADYTDGRTSDRAAILVHPRGNDDGLDIPAIRFMLMNARRALEERRLTGEEIYLLSYTPFLSRTGSPNPDPIVDAPVTLGEWAREDRQPRDITVEDVERAFDWAIDRGQLAEPLLFVFVGHGIEDALRLDPMHGQLTGDALAAMLDRYQAATGNKVTVILEACYSGTLLPFLAGANRIVISSTGEKRAFYEDTGRGSYSRLLFSELRIGQTLYDAFVKAANELPRLGAGVFGDQHPQLDDDGDGVFTERDGALARQYRINSYGALDLPVRLAPQIESGVVQPGDTVDLRVEVSMGAEAVWALILTPETVQQRDLNGYPLLPAPTVDLVPEDTATWRGRFAGFAYRGEYTVTFHARDRGGFITSSAPVVFTVEAGAEAMARPVSSQPQYGRHDQIRVRIPAAPAGYTTYLGMTIPGLTDLLLFTERNVPVLFDGASLPAWRGTGSLVLDLPVAAGLPSGAYTVYLLHAPAGRNPLDPQTVNQWRLGLSTFEVHLDSR